MHKSVTLSDLTIATTQENSDNKFRKNVISKIAIGLIEFLLSSVLYCYGLIFSEYVLLGSHKYNEGIFTSLLFICCWSLTDPLQRFTAEYFENKKSTFFKWIIGIGTIILFIGIIIPGNLVFYMVIAGIISSFISSQLTFIAVEKLEIKSTVFESFKQIFHAIGLLLMPHFVFYLIENYEINQSRFIFGSIILNIIPLSWLVRRKKKTYSFSEITRYQTIGHQSYQLNDLINNIDPNKSSSALSDTDSQSSSSSIEDNNDENNFTDFQTEYLNSNDFYQSENNIIGQTQLKFIPNDNNNNIGYYSNFGINNSKQTAANVQYYYQRIGVSILPGIPEENEETTSEDINYIDPKRLSKISEKLEALNNQNNTNNTRKDSIKEEDQVSDQQQQIVNINEIIIKETKPEPIDAIEYIPNFKNPKSFFSIMDEMGLNRRQCSWCCQCSTTCGGGCGDDGCCSPYRKYVWTRRIRMLYDFCFDNFFRPLYYSLKNIYFYPSLTTRIITNFVSILYITLCPFMAMEKSWKQSLLNTENATFLLTYIAFAWCFCLLFLPLILKFYLNKIRYFFVFGLICSGSSLLLLSGKLTNDTITISSLLFGFGYGIIRCTERLVFKKSIGNRSWYLIQGTLEIFSAIFTIIIYYTIRNYRLNLKSLLMLAALAYYFNAILWLLFPFVKYFIEFIKKSWSNRKNQLDELFFD